jgi:hypothetical protein
MNDTETRAEALLDAVRSAHDPTADDRDRVRVALGAALGPAASIGAGTALPEAAGSAAEVSIGVKALSTKLIVGGSLIGAIGVGGGVVALTGAQPPAGNSSTVHAAQPVAVAVPAPKPEAVTGASHELSPIPDEPVVEPPEPQGAAVRATATASAIPSHSGLAEEIALLRRAQQALGKSQAERSLSLLDEMAERHPNGQMGEEAAAARVLALCGAERRAEARAQARRFLSAYPGSVLTQRVRSSCAFQQAPSKVQPGPTDSAVRGQLGGRLETDGTERKVGP